MQFSIEEQKKIAQTGRYSLIDFSIITNKKYQPSWLHEEIADKLEAVERGDIRRLMLFVPPRHGKSQLATINFPAWYLGRNPDKEIITASYSSDLAVDFGSKTREIISDELFNLIFVKPRISLRQDEKAKAKWRTNLGGSYISVGVGGPITGRGANILIIDDPIKNREEADSQTIRDKIWSWYISTAYTRLEKNAAVILILTRWHLDDLAGRLLQAQAKGADAWEVVKFPAIAIQNEQYRKKGQALWPEKYDLETLESIKKTTGMYDWSALYQQEPILSENQEFKIHWFQKRQQDDLKTLNTRNFISIDTAISEKASADYTGIIRNYVDDQNNWNIKAERLRINPKELIDRLFYYQEQENFEKIGIEKTIYLQAIKPFLDEEMRNRDKFLPIIELEHQQISKGTRIRGLIPRYESKSIYHIENECQVLEEELLTFPKGMNDDVLDALAYQLQIAHAPTQRDRESLMNILENRQSRQKYEYQ